MKKLLALLLIAILSACGGNQTPTEALPTPPIPEQTPEVNIDFAGQSFTYQPEYQSLLRNVLTDIVDANKALYACNQNIKLNAQITNQQENFIRELWQLNTCENSVREYLVDFAATAEGKIVYQVLNK